MVAIVDTSGKQYVLGKGQVFFDQFPAGTVVTSTTRGTGELYLGNTPEYTLTQSANKLDHFDSDAGVKQLDSSVQLDITRNIKMMCDNINAANLALFFQGQTSTVTQTSQVGVVETLTVLRGRHYQLGMSASQAAGARKIANVVVKTGSPGFATTVTATGNYQVDVDLGRIFIEPASVGIADNTIIQVTYDNVASTREQIISGNAAVYGALRFVANNPNGTQRDHYYPYVMLQPNGDFALKGDTWQQVGFSAHVLLKSASIPAGIIDGRAI